MEEHVGLWWHRWVTRWADDRHLEACVTLLNMEKRIGLMYRAAGGNAITRIEPSASLTHDGPRGWLQRLAGSGQRAALPQLDAQVLALPSELAVFPRLSLNQDLYLWLAAMAAVYEHTGDWIADNRAATSRALQRFAGLRARHHRLVQEQLKVRPLLSQMRAKSVLAESAVQAALLGKDHETISVQPSEVWPVWIWLTVGENVSPFGPPSNQAESDSENGLSSEAIQSRTRRRAREVNEPDPRRALLMPSRVESIMSWSEFVKIDRATDDEDDPNAITAADDMDALSISRSSDTQASRVRFDLDLPSASQDDLPAGDGELVPEWDWRSQILLPKHCSLQYFTARHAQRFEPSAALRSTARQLRRRLEVLRAAPHWLHRQEQGDAIDVDAWVRFQSERQVDRSSPESVAIYMQRQRTERSMATLLLADLSLSTDAYATSQMRVIEVIRDALYVFGEALSASGDAFEMTGFSSIRRQQVRMHRLKAFEEEWSDYVRARVGAIKPGYYTRLGAALRGATKRLLQRPEQQRLLIVLTDGKPNDLDIYEGRYGLEDTRRAVQEAKAHGLLPFCVTIDEKHMTTCPCYLVSKVMRWYIVHKN